MFIRGFDDQLQPRLSINKPSFATFQLGAFQYPLLNRNSANSVCANQALVEFGTKPLFTVTRTWSDFEYVIILNSIPSSRNSHKENFYLCSRAMSFYTKFTGNGQLSRKLGLPSSFFVLLLSLLSFFYFYFSLRTR